MAELAALAEFGNRVGAPDERLIDHQLSVANWAGGLWPTYIVVCAVAHLHVVGYISEGGFVWWTIGPESVATYTQAGGTLPWKLEKQRKFAGMVTVDREDAGKGCAI